MTSPAAAADVVEIEGVGPIGITWSPARGMKCGRCWQYREEVTPEVGLCARCQSVIDDLSVPDMPTV